jgi:hypothetical protein
MLETFCDMNLEMARTGNFSTQIGKEQLLRLVAHNNVILVRAHRHTIYVIIVEVAKAGSETGCESRNERARLVLQISTHV